MAYLHYNFQSGTITDSPLLIGATTINSAAFANLPEITGNDRLYLVLDPTAVAGTPEIVLVTAHSAAATSLTVTRGQQTSMGGGAARQHLVNTIWRLALTAQETRYLPHTLLTTKGDLMTVSAVNTPVRHAVGTNGMILIADSAQTNGMKWGLLPAFNLRAVADVACSDGAITTISLDTEVLDTDGFHTGTDGFVTIPAGLGGDYLLTAGIEWGTSATGFRSMNVALSSNGTNGEGNLTFRSGGFTPASTNDNGLSFSKLCRLEAGAVVTLTGFQNSGGALNVVEGFLTGHLVRHVPSLT